MNYLRKKTLDMKKVFIVLGIVTLLLSVFVVLKMPVVFAQSEDIKIDEDIDILLPEDEQSQDIIHEVYSVAPEGFERYAVTYHIFITGVPGPNIAIIGGVHGSERAGFSAAQYLLGLMKGDSLLHY